MWLAQLSEASGTSPASVKFYLRTGLLQPGETINPTRSRYGDAHLHRLRLIRELRSQVGLGLDDIRRIIDAAEGAEDSLPRRLALLATVQSVVLGLHDDQTEAPGDGDALISAMGWPDESSQARTAVDRQLLLMREVGVGVEPEILRAYASAADTIAQAQLGITEARERIEDFILTAALGMHLHNQLILKIIALAQASRSIARYGSPSSPRPEVPVDEKGAAGSVRRS